MNQWSLHPQLEADSLLIRQDDDVQLRLLNERRYPWLIIIPKVPGATELHHLPVELQSRLLRIANRISKHHLSNGVSTKVNMAYLGNVVPQFHFHVVGRNERDPAWPDPVWGHSPRQPLDATNVSKMIPQFKDVDLA